jgi:hypothetical protein
MGNRYTWKNAPPATALQGGATVLLQLGLDLTQSAARRGGIWPMLEVMSIIDGYSRRHVPREDMPMFDDFLKGEMTDFDTGNGLTTPTPINLIEMAKYLETLQDPAPTGYVP